MATIGMKVIDVVDFWMGGPSFSEIVFLTKCLRKRRNGGIYQIPPFITAFFAQ